MKLSSATENQALQQMLIMIQVRITNVATEMMICRETIIEINETNKTTSQVIK